MYLLRPLIAATCAVSLALVSVALVLGRALFTGDVLAFIASTTSTTDIYLLDLSTGLLVNLTHDSARQEQLVWSPDGTRIAFISDAEIHIIDASGGNPRQLTHHELTINPYSPEWAWSPDGRRIAFWASHNGNAEIYTVDVDTGDLLNLTHHPAGDWFPIWSPDGKRIAFWSNRTGKLAVHLMDSDGGNVRLLSDYYAAYGSLAWSPDGSQIVFVGRECAMAICGNIYLADPDNGDISNLTNFYAMYGSPAWSPDRQWLTFWSGGDRRPNDVYVMDLETHSVRDLSPALDEAAAWSPSGSWLVFTSDVDGSGRYASIYALDVEQQRLLSLNDGQARFYGLPVWSPDGQRAAFWADTSGSSAIHVVEVRTGRSWRFVLPVTPLSDPAWRPRFNGDRAGAVDDL